MVKFSRLSAMPLFLRNKQFWNAAIDPKTYLGLDTEDLELRVLSGSHRWDIDDKKLSFHELNKNQIGLLDIAQGILERGIWTIPSWEMEKYLANQFSEKLKWTIAENKDDITSLDFKVTDSLIDVDFNEALVTARWECESTDGFLDNIWDSQLKEFSGSLAERTFLEHILIPGLKFPLLDYLQLQVELTSLGLDPTQFTGQRVDFAINNGRGFKLIIEIDGHQHINSAQTILDKKRDEALLSENWTIWRITTKDLANPNKLKIELNNRLLRDKNTYHWGVKQKLKSPRSKDLINCVWGASVSSRIHFLLLESLRVGLLPWDKPWKIGFVEHDTEIAIESLRDFRSWFARLRNLYEFSNTPEIIHLSESQFEDANLIIDISIINPYKKSLNTDVPIAWSRPANCIAPIHGRNFSTRLAIAGAPSKLLIESFVQDYLRKPSLVDGQYEIISRILKGQNVIGLLPTGGGKSLTYQLSSLLLGGLTVYVSPLKSLLQDQYERLIQIGLDLAVQISSSLNTLDREKARLLLVTGKIRFLLIAPERFLISNFRDDLNQFRVRFGEVSQVVIDECHCVSEWGHDFRFSYLSLSRIVKDRTKRLDVSAPLVALTGTASSIVLSDVQRELGITQHDAIIRAKRLDRPEISMSCLSLSQKQKIGALQKIIQNFQINNQRPLDGLLAFCKVIGGSDGVLSVTGSTLEIAPKENVRFYCGQEPNWAKYARVMAKEKRNKITQNEIKNQIPIWALQPDGKEKNWEEVKAEVQRNFISNSKDGYQILIATSAFGMGIDKPSIRQIIHFMTPQSPEAYYQEVGRAGRDKKASSAILLFSDEAHEITDKILDPTTNIDEAIILYDEYSEKNKYSGGDFIRTFWFHKNSFAGSDHETNYIVTLLDAIRTSLLKLLPLNFNYIADNKDSRSAWKIEKNLEKSIVRLIYLGVIQDYTKDYKEKIFEITLNLEWQNCRNNIIGMTKYLSLKFREYSGRYFDYVDPVWLNELSNTNDTKNIERTVIKGLVEYIYEKIERKRRQASRQMLELARKCIVDEEGFKEGLMLYLQASRKFTQDLESLINDKEQFSWINILKNINVNDANEIKELHGACQRILESYPTQPGLLSISCITRVNPTNIEQKRSQEDFNAALQFSNENYGIAIAKAHGDAIVDNVKRINKPLYNSFATIFGLWLIKAKFIEEAADFFNQKPVRDYWITKTVKDIQYSLPQIDKF